MILVVYANRQKVIDFLQNQAPTYYDSVDLNKMTATKDGAVVKFISIHDDLNEIKGLEFDNVYWDECRDFPDYENKRLQIQSRIR